MRVKITVAYDGTKYHGWQVQNNGDTIEGMLNRAIFELTGEETEVIGASRTDAGVHAYGNIAVFDTNSSIPAEKIGLALNTRLPEDIRVVKSEEVSDSFHPRHCDSLKTYEYRMYCSETAVPLFDRYSYYIKHHQCPDVDRMNEAAAILIGRHDFKSFCSVHTQAESTIREVTAIEVTKTRLKGVDQSWEVCVTITGKGFLYNMVRIIAGTLLEVGRGRKSVEQVREMLDSCDRKTAGPTLPACGLTLLKYTYI